MSARKIGRSSIRSDLESILVRDGALNDSRTLGDITHSQTTIAHGSLLGSKE